MLVYVVEWEYNTGGGFDWYYTKEAQEEAYEKEAENCKGFKDCNWTRKKYEIEVEGEDREDITRQIDKQIW